MTAAIPDENLFSILPDDCIFELFDWLPLSDLCLCSRLCKRFQVLVENHFRRKYQYKANIEVEVRIGFGGKVYVSPNDYYLKYFGKFMKNLKIVFWSSRESDDGKSDEDESDEDMNVNMSSLINFIKNKCDKNLNRICIEGNVVLDPLCTKIKKFLRNVEIVEFINRTVTSHQDEAKFLKHCPGITKLILEDMTETQNANAVFQQAYPKLRDFYYINGYTFDLSIKDLKTFFQHNKKIKTVAWRFHYNNVKRLAIECMQTVDYAVNLEHLFLLICRLLADSFDSICSYLNLLCDRDHFQSLEIEFEGTAGAGALKMHANKLANLKQLTKIHLTYLLLTEVIPVLRSLLNLRVIVLSDLTLENDLNNWFDLNDIIAVVDNAQNVDLPHIAEVHLVDIDDEQACVYIMLFTRHWKKLQRIFLPASMYSGTVLNVSMMDRERHKLKDACELTIFTNHQGNVTNLDHRLVKLKRVSFDYASSTKDATAFQRYYMTS